jgi:hypothetical protein
MTAAEVEVPGPREQLNLEPFTEDERIRLAEVMLDEASVDAPNRRGRGGTDRWNFVDQQRV